MNLLFNRCVAPCRTLSFGELVQRASKDTQEEYFICPVSVHCTEHANKGNSLFF